ncbi:low affinity immunoglobulin gamma Fc region receptor II-a-like [Solea senegalensis]|nr:low affinity immunoglobulin gamma Fc region receptor II-a-like [Solea senegalensis]
MLRMEVAVLSVCILMNMLDFGQTQASLTVTPERSQFFKYDSFSVSCYSKEEKREEEEEEWTVMRRMLDGEVGPCPSPCSVTAAFPSTDSGLYWCQTGTGRNSTSVNITVTASLVILDIPLHPVAVGDDVTLHCRCKCSTKGTDFSKDGIHIASSLTENLTLHGVSESDAGLYSCTVPGVGTSAGTWLSVTAPPAVQNLLLSASSPLRHLIVGSPFLLSTILLGLVYRDRKRVLRANEAGQRSDDVIMQIDI